MSINNRQCVYLLLKSVQRLPQSSVIVDNRRNKFWNKFLKLFVYFSLSSQSQPADAEHVSGKANFNHHKMILIDHINN